MIGLTSDTTQTTVATYSYDPWGALTAIGGTDPALAARQPLRYRSYYYDAESGLYRLPARRYDPATARFLTPDPAAPAASDPLGLNRYSYCEDSPVQLVDPSGLIPDYDGNGKIDTYDNSEYAARHTSNRKLRNYWSAKARRQYYSSLLVSSARLGARARARAARLVVSYGIQEALAWAEISGVTDFYLDFSGSYTGFGEGGLLGLMGGEILDCHDGAVVDKHAYYGVCIGFPGLAGSIMIGAGSVRPDARYIEMGGGQEKGGAYGWRSDNDRSAPWDWSAMGAHIRANDYWQFGLCQPEPSGGISWFYVQ